MTGANTDQYSPETDGSTFTDLSAVRLHRVEKGSGQPVVLLHGFPDFWMTWDTQLDALAEGGLRCIAPDMRGYNLSDKPEGVSRYAVEALVADVAELIEKVCGGRAHVIGHDWGGIVAWYLAMWRRELVDRLVIANVTHPARFAEMTRTPQQLLKSWYVAFFQVPVLPERWISANDYSILKRMLRGASKSFTGEHLAAWQTSAERSRGLHYPINYYRALLRRNPFVPERQLEVIEAETLVLWGERDVALDRRFAAPDRRWVPRLRVERFADAGHWVHRDAPGEVNDLIADHLTAG